MAAIKSMKDLYVSLLKDSYDSEKQITKALPKMAKAAETAELRLAFEKHLQETYGQLERLDKVFHLLDMKPKGKTCEATKGLGEEAAELIEMDVEPGVMDAGLIANAQKVEHYEIASYGTLCEFAIMLGFKDQAKLLKEILEQEKATDKKLTQLAETRINQMAEAA